MIQQFHTWVFIKKKINKRSTNYKRYAYPYVYHNIIYNNQDMKATLVSTDDLIFQMWYILTHTYHKGALFSHIKNEKCNL